MNQREKDESECCDGETELGEERLNLTRSKFSPGGAGEPTREAHGNDNGDQLATPCTSNFVPLSTCGDRLADESAVLEDDLMTSLVPRSENNSNHSNPILAASDTMRKIGPYLAYITLTSMLILIPTVIYQAAIKKRVDLAVFDSGAVMVIGTVVMSLRLVYLHLSHWHMPDVQKYVVRILWMVPLYSVQSFLSLRFHKARIYIDAIRDFYEAYVIASFVYYLIELLGGEDALVRRLRQKNNPELGRHAFPLHFVIQPWELGVEFMLQCKHGVLQYVVTKLLATMLTFLCQSLGVYGEGDFDWTTAYPYMTFFMNVSVMYALYCLIKLYYAVNEDLCHPIDWRPLGKFLCVKGVVFFTWWQGVVIYLLRSKGIIEDIGSWKSDEVANGLIDYCICVEMVFFAIAHAYTFTYKEYLPSSLPPTEEYQPPAIRTLSQPMQFYDAFWSSTLPKETLSDIQRLSNGIDNVVSQSRNSGSISLPDVPNQLDDDACEDGVNNSKETEAVQQNVI